MRVFIILYRMEYVVVLITRIGVALTFIICIL